MPTGYTAAIEKGCTFEEYVWGCARGMGACVTMRDAAWDKPIPQAFEPSSYYKKSLEEDEAKLAAIQALTDEEIVERQVQDNAEIRAQNEKWRLEAEDLKQKYQAMRLKVEAWNPPSPDHKGLKEFMLQQIGLCERDGEPYKTEEKRMVTPAEWRKDAIAGALREIARSRDEWNKEQERVNGRNLWLKQLRDSVPQPSKGSE